MDQNKSIDGLVTRRSKIATSKAVKQKPKTSTKTTSKKTSSVPKKTNVSLTKTKTSTSPLIKAKDTPTPNTPPTKKNNVTEDFLKPVQAFDFDEESGELKVAEEPVNLSKKTKRKERKPMSKKRRIIISIILAIILLIIAGAIWLVLWGNDIIAKITGGQGNIFNLITFIEPTYEPLKTDENGRTNILAFGTSGYNMDGDEGNGVHDGAQLTDSIMVISLNQETGDLAMLSLPRDLKASPTCTATGKINEIYWCNNMDGNNEQTGAEALMTDVSNILGIDFQYYAHINWGSLVQIVDTLDGITVTLDEGIYDYYWTGSVYEPGVPYTINGIQAVALARARHGTTSGDFSRGASQQKILIGIKEKIFEKNLSLTDMLSLASTLGDNLRTNFSLEEMKTLAHLTSNFDFNNIRQISLIEPEMLLTTGTINNISYVLPVGGAGYYSKIQDYIAKMFSSDPRAYENSTILILNGTETPGLASNEKDALEEDGYQNIYIDDAPEGEYSEEYTIYALTGSATGTKKLLEEKYNQSAKTIDDLPENISRDYDFMIIIGSNKL